MAGPALWAMATAKTLVDTVLQYEDGTTQDVHSLVLRARIPAMRDVGLDRWIVRGQGDDQDVLKVEGFPAQAMRELVQWCYNGQLTPDLPYAVATKLYEAAHMFMMDELLEETLLYLANRLKANNTKVELLFYLKWCFTAKGTYQDQPALEECFSITRQMYWDKAGSTLQQLSQEERDTFKTFPVELLNVLFGENSRLPEVCETDVFTTIDQWVNAGDDNKWEDVVHLIRFMTISEEDYIRSCMTSESFPRETMVSLAQIIVANDSRPLAIPEWINGARRPLGEGVTTICRYGETRVGDWQGIPPVGSSICVGSDGPFHLHGIGLYTWSDNSYKVKVTIVDFGTGVIEAATTCVIVNQQTEEGRRVIFPVPLRISPNKRYRVCVSCRGGGMYSQYGIVGCKQKIVSFPLTGTKVTLTFYDSPNSTTSVSQGQVPTFYISV